ncbi:hypothetical protein GH808_00950 [Acetobacterium fimetarium]|uniref:Uncharacterized protein n=1 Tax=Acetobacterium fimetarium TaxID=52691 RepID=A0ABR6WRZ6_9FIRM|nr:hypothetical protein [Acetobacterium fimetarium]MBC3803011.1 hypothetical protein [Acetobacterium fimetarium]
MMKNFKKKMKTLQGSGKRLRDLDAFFNVEGFYFNWNTEEMDAFFRNAQDEMRTLRWQNENGSTVYLIITVDELKRDIYDSTLNVMATEYLSFGDKQA